ncbi:MAG TPA: TonB family protein [Thermoanaerobaculia bacterium]|jgi:TonB family protein|nr:TonB family protein [Thermoanaerobaculia bacterium]
MPDAQTRHTRGLTVVIILGVIFFALLALLILRSGKPKDVAPQSLETLSVLSLRLRLRTQPTANAPVVATAANGEKLIVLEDRGAWVRVQDDDGMTGWAERNSLERTSERERRLARYEAIRKLPALSALVSARTPLYAGPGIFYPIIGELTAETQVKVYTRDHDFYAIDHDNQIAYADVDAIDVSSAGTRQVEVHTDSTATDTASSSATATSPVPTESQAPAQPAPQVNVATDNGGVYSAVPPGGTQPEETDRVVPRYPMIARRAGIQGPVVVRGIVRRDGTIDNVEVIKDLPYGLGEAASEAVSQWHFRPATYRGEPIDVYYTVTVNFRLQ